MLEAQERAEEQTTLQQRRLATRQHQGRHEETVHGAIVLKVYMIDDEQSWRQDDRQRGGLGSSSCRQGRRVDKHLQSIHQEQLGYNDRESLEVDRLPAIVVEVDYSHHGRVDQSREMGQKPLEVGEEGRVVEGPF